MVQIKVTTWTLSPVSYLAGGRRRVIVVDAGEQKSESHSSLTTFPFFPLYFLISFYNQNYKYLSIYMNTRDATVGSAI
jgi:hypothetical protein